MKSKWFYATAVPVVIACFFSCSGRDRRAFVMNFSEVADSLVKVILPPGVELQTGRSSVFFNDSMLQRKSAVLIPFSALNQFDYRRLNFLKRYLESGGTGIVAIRDTLLSQTAIPWFRTWIKLNPGEKQGSVNRQLYILERGYSIDQLKIAIASVLDSIQRPGASVIRTLPVPDSNQYAKITLSGGLDEPMQMTILPGNDVLIIERKGAVRLYKDKERALKTVANVSVFSGIEDGLLGICADPDFKNNRVIYLCYSLPGESAVNRLSRFRFLSDSLVLSSEKVMLEYPTQRRYCCHSAGAITFDSGGNLYLSTGDNTNAEETEGYTPVDERPGRHLSDDQATAGNSMDLRGKILRIHPEPDGSYSIPAGNLFPPGGNQGRPEIFVMGCRNPFRVSVDPKNGYVYWGDVGPDTKVMSDEGLMSFDEFNQAKKAGFFGWPYFLADNKVFPHYNYATKKTGPGKDPARPLNLSPNNTGTKNLPAAQPAMVWYNKSASSKFPLVGKGGASAMAGPVFYRDKFPESRYRLSAYYDGKLIVYDWVRRWLMALSFDEQGNYLYMEPFLDHFRFASPIDIKFSPDGALYILEYGSNGFAKNADAKLTRIEFQEGNRDPVPEISVDKQYGALPLQVRLSAKNSRDFDPGDKLTYEWTIGAEKFKGISLDYTFKDPGAHKVELTVSDNRKGNATKTIDIFAGNEPPAISIETSSNRTFYLDNQELSYHIAVKDDNNIDTSSLNIHFGYIAHGNDAAVILANGEAPLPENLASGKALLSSLDCKSCHRQEGTSAGPSYKMIAGRYATDKTAPGRLAKKIINGGSGNWGTRAMAAHPDLPEKSALSIVEYILSTTNESSSLPAAGKLKLNRHTKDQKEGVYLLIADYTDKGSQGLPPVSSREYLLLRNPRLEAETFDEGNVALTTVTTLFLTYARTISGSYMKFDNLDLSGINKIDYRVQPAGIVGIIEMRIDSITGDVISRMKVPAGTKAKTNQDWVTLQSDVIPIRDKHSVYFIFRGEAAGVNNLFNLDWLKFGQ